ncbi:MAG TPA: glucan biosynthesis glucosyltransferase H, partial [Beijerinckiaceae bacterium]|nr:glucan biosynthesis glucosyltransferase H [Beijerinckiaceae bacterium]
MALPLDALKPAQAPITVPWQPEPAVPPENQLVMPVQSFTEWPRGAERAATMPRADRGVWLTRLAVFGGALLLTAYGAWEMYQVVSVSRTTVLQWVLLVLFTINFSWIALAFTSAL